MDKEIAFIEEIYTDEYRTLFQAIIIDVKLDEACYGLERRQCRASVNPNLTKLIETRYLNKNWELIRREREEEDEQ